MRNQIDSLPSFRQTPFGFESQSRDGRHTYVLSFNSIDFDVTHYYCENPQGELIDRASLENAPKVARDHYVSLQR